MSGADREAIDSRSRSLGYSVGPWPLVPLEGPVIEHNRGFLEVYETILELESSDSASQYALFRGANLDGAAPTAVPAFGGAQDVFTADYYLGENDGQHQHVLRIFVRIHTSVMDFALEGGSGVEMSQAIALAAPKVKALLQCDSGGK